MKKISRSFPVANTIEAYFCICSSVCEITCNCEYWGESYNSFAIDVDKDYQLYIELYGSHYSGK